MATKTNRSSTNCAGGRSALPCRAAAVRARDERRSVSQVIRLAIEDSLHLRDFALLNAMHPGTVLVPRGGGRADRHAELRRRRAGRRLQRAAPGTVAAS